MGFTPRQHAYSKVSKMGEINKRGDRYLRKQLVDTTSDLVSRAAKSSDALSLRVIKLCVINRLKNGGCRLKLVSAFNLGIAHAS